LTRLDSRLASLGVAWSRPALALSLALSRRGRRQRTLLSPGPGIGQRPGPHGRAADPRRAMTTCPQTGGTTSTSCRTG